MSPLLQPEHQWTIDFCTMAAFEKTGVNIALATDAGYRNIVTFPRRYAAS